MITVINNDVQTTPIEANGNEYTFDVFNDYSFLALQYVVDGTSSFHINRITRDILAIDPTTDIKAIEDGNINSPVVETRVFNVAGQSVKQFSKGVNIVRQKLENGRVITKKMIKK
jgi:hypothetical protein